LRTMISHQRPLNIMYDILSLTNSTLLTADMILSEDHRKFKNGSGDWATEKLYYMKFDNLSVC
jgi:hypothetical protein